MIRKFLVAAVAAIGFSTSANAVVIAQYDMANVVVGAPPGSQSLAASAVDGSFTASALTLNNAANNYGGIQNHFYHAGWDTTLNPAKYYEVTIGAVSAFTLDTIDFAMENLIETPSTFTLRTSVDGFAADLATGAFGNGLVTDFSVDASVLGVLTGPVTLRWFLTAPITNTLSGFANHECPGNGCNLPDVGQDLLISGDLVAVSEPGALALLGLSLAAFGALRRRAA